MRVLKLGLQGSDVKQWEIFLHGQGLDPGVVDGLFDTVAKQATEAFQQKHKLGVDGKVGNQTLGKAGMLGFQLTDDPQDDTKHGPNFPPLPTFSPLLSTAERQALFGKFKFVPDPQPGNKEQIRIIDDWEVKNIVKVELPQLKDVKGAPKSGVIRFHQAGAKQLAALWAAWEKAGLLPLVLSWGGSFVPRFVRGSNKSLSNHAFGSAFDINVAANPLGVMPPLVGKLGSVRELVPLANDHGFFWGGHFKGRRDGMHFEIAALK